MSAPIAQHRARSRRVFVVASVVGTVAVLSGVAVGMAAREKPTPAVAVSAMSEKRPPLLESIPAPELSSVPVETALCNTPAVKSALDAHDTRAVIAAVGGAESFRQAIIAGTNQCLQLDDPARVWVVVNKARPFADITWAPTDIVTPATRNQGVGELRAEAAAALDSLSAASVAEGAGEIALNSGYRSYRTQVSSYGSQVAATGREEADHQSARPGHSEHQSGLAADVVPCNPDCGTLDDVASSKQGSWIAANSWRFGWIVRYEDGRTPVTGYTAEPWHLRYIGVDLATRYREGGFHTLEEFFGLPAAPDYVG